mmetsp:Transcript_133892/g.317426  ORF Transcript_133892/g.317426 Transcript_133892/m.317426 type:complete len:247 (+) Transcript_133892:689-1429(+)
MSKTLDSAFRSSARTSFFRRASSSSFSRSSFSRTVSRFTLDTKTGFMSGPRLASSSDSESYSLSSGISSCSSSISAFSTSSSIFRFMRACSRILSRRTCRMSRSSSSEPIWSMFTSATVGLRSTSNSSLKTSFFASASSFSSLSASRITAASTRRCRSSLSVPVSAFSAERCSRARRLEAPSEARTRSPSASSTAAAAACRRRLAACFRSASSSLFSRPFFSGFLVSSAHSGIWPFRYLATFLVPS